MSEIAECVSSQMKTLEQMKNENRDIMEKFLEFEAKNQERQNQLILTVVKEFASAFKK